MTPKHLFGIAAIIMSVGYLLQSLPEAQALNTPAVDLGANPYRSFHGLGPNHTMSLDSTQDFIVTTVMSDNSSCALLVNGSSVHSTSQNYNPFFFYAGTQNSNAFTSGQGHLVIPSGASFALANCGTWYLEGYYVRP